MDIADIAKKLTSLLHLDVDCARAYGHAIRHVSSDVVRAALESFRADHERHIRDLQGIIEALGEPRPSARPDARGILREGLTALRSFGGSESALKAMLSEEHLCAERYEEALAWELPIEIRAIITRFWQHERQHHDFLQDASDMHSYLTVDAGAAT